MVYMKRDVKFSLLILLVAIFICLAAVNVYYQIKLNNLYSSLEDDFDQIRNISSTLENESNISQTDRLKQISYQLRVKEEREENLTSQYDELKEEEKVEGEKSKIENLEEQLHSKFTELEQINEEADQVQSKFVTINSYTKIFIFLVLIFFLTRACVKWLLKNRKPI